MSLIPERFIRTEMLIGAQGLARLQASSVAVFGVGGVGSHAAEALARAGVGRLVLTDSDVIAKSNLNRQIHALESTIGQHKTSAMKARILEINPACVIEENIVFITAENAASYINTGLSYVIDAVDNVTAKLAIIAACKRLGVPVISCMGTGNKLDPSRFEIADISKTSVCPLCRVMRKELKDRGIGGVPVVFSKEEPRKPLEQLSENGRHPPASISFVPPAAGLLLASRVVGDLLNAI